MFDAKRITVVVPAYNEERLIGRTLVGIPRLVDHVIVVDDASRDGTVAALASVRDARVAVICRERNGGVGAAIVTGYRSFLAGNDDVCVVMAGDAQMDPADLVALIAPVCEDRADYSKGDRLQAKDTRRVMPRDRFIGNIVFTLLTKWASGYWHVVDSQCGYTAVSRDALAKIDLDHVYERYGFPNDFLIRLNVVQARVCDVPVRAIYDEEVSGIDPVVTIPRICLLLVRGFWSRMWHRYVLRDFHPLALLYAFGFLLVFLGFAGGAWISILRLFLDVAVTTPTVVFFAICLIVGFQSVLFAMTFDMIHNSDLKVRAHAPRAAPVGERALPREAEHSRP